MVTKKNLERIDINRPSWDEMFIAEAILWSNRSHDAQTKCGCVLVKEKTVISTGYNGFIRSINDKSLPNLRPAKYDYMIHAEHNAILNCARNGISTKDAIAYISGMPCNWCLQYMWQAGIKDIKYSDYSNPKMNDTEDSDNVYYKLINLISNEINLQFIPMKRCIKFYEKKEGKRTRKCKV